jgi:tetratricopeptide (TPR) repeat protein
MRKIFLIAAVSFLFTDALAQIFQTYNIDSLKKVLNTELPDTNRIWVLNNLGRNIPNSDTVITLAEQAIELSRKIGFTKGEAEAYNNIGYWVNQQGNYPKALENYLRSIQLSESVNYEAGLKRSFNSISTVYLYLKDYESSLRYAEKARRLSIKLKDMHTLVLSTSWLSKAYLELHRTDSALRYAQLSYETAIALNEPMPLYFATARLGEINEATGNYSLALEYLRMSLNFSKKDGRYFRISGAHQQLAMVFKNTGMRDSCLWHAQKAFLISKEENLYATLLSSSLLLSELYEGRNDSESLRYHKFSLAAQDSLFSQEKNRQIAELSFNETLRQQELEAAKHQAAEDRKNNLQYAAIALGLVLFVILFLLLSHTIVANQIFIKFLGTLALLIVFEFMNLLLGPFIGSFSNNSPLLMLTIMVCIAALLIPVHQKLDKWITHKLIEKNNKIRLAAAKKIIASLEEKQ